ncbi:MAG: hypothetical protein ACREJM_11830, partial [Candidatus Saccharimonadales bacterium]
MQLTLPPVRLALIPDGRAGTIATLKVMASIVKAWRKFPLVRDAAVAIIGAVPGKRWFAEIEAVFEWVRQNLRYTQDINGVETLYTPQRMLEDILAWQSGEREAPVPGDCDDFC